MAFLDDLLNIPGASGWLSGILGGGPNLNQQPVSFNDRYPDLPPAVQQTPIFNQPSPEQAGRPLTNPLDYYTNPFGGLQVPTAAPGPALDMSARQRTAPVPAITQADIQQAPQQTPQPAGPDFMSRLQAGASNFTSSDSPLTGLVNSIAGLATGQRTDAVGIAQQNQKQAALAMFQVLRSRGVPEQQAYGLAQLVSMNPKLAEQILKPDAHTVGPGDKLVGIGPGGQASTLAEGGPQKPPAGYEWADANNPSGGLKPIAGGPESKLPAQEAGYLAMMEAARPGVAQAAKFFLDPNFGKNPVSALGQATGSFEIGRQQRNIRYAVEAALRVATGAAAPESEVTRWSDMYMPSVYDNFATRQQKITALQNFMNSATEKMQQGRMPSSPNAGWVDMGGGIRIREKK